MHHCGGNWRPHGSLYMRRSPGYFILRVLQRYVEMGISFIFREPICFRHQLAFPTRSFIVACLNCWNRPVCLIRIPPMYRPDLGFLGCINFGICAPMYEDSSKSSSAELSPPDSLFHRTVSLGCNLKGRSSLSFRPLLGDPI